MVCKTADGHDHGLRKKGSFELRKGKTPALKLRLISPHTPKSPYVLSKHMLLKFEKYY